MNVLVSKFQQGWARAKDTLAAGPKAHFFIREQVGAAGTLCEVGVEVWAGQLYEPGTSPRCKRCESLLVLTADDDA